MSGLVTINVHYDELVVYLCTGAIVSGLLAHPDGKHLIYPIGCTVAIEEIKTKRQDFLSGHTNNVSCVAIAKSGQYIASGQVTYMGFKVSR